MKSSQWRALVAANIKARRDAELGLRVEQAAAVEEAPKFCKDCAHHSCVFDREKGKVRHFCDCPPLLHMITGEKSNPAVNRNTETLCGRAAKHFTPRRPVIEQQPVAIQALTSSQEKLDTSFVSRDESEVCATEAPLAMRRPRLRTE